MGSISEDNHTSVAMAAQSQPANNPFVYYEDGFHLQLNGNLNGMDVDVSSETSVDERKRKRLSSFFEENSFRHILVLSGAGTSIAAGGKTREGLWTSCEKEIKAVVKAAGKYSLYGERDKDIEMFLSYAERLCSVLEDGDLNNAVVVLKKAILGYCSLTYKASNDHANLLRKLTARKPGLPRVEVFTTNYDTLFEQAARESGFVVIDGFSFSFPRTFSGRNFDLDIVNRERTRLKGEENFIPNVIHLLKLHGSVDWFRDSEGIIEQRIGKEAEEPLIIYPSSEKYAASYDQPYFEMMSRFQTALRRDNTLLIVLGFGFADKHLNNTIIEAVRQNPGFHLLVADYGHSSGGIDLGKYQNLFRQIDGNISIVHASFHDFVEALPMNKSYSIQRFDQTYPVQGGHNEHGTI